MNDRMILSVGITQDFSNCEERNEVVSWLEATAPLTPVSQQHAKNALKHIHELEALIPIEKYASLSNMANDMRKHLAEIRLNQTDDFNKGYQTAINIVIDAFEDHDANTQAATSIAEIQASTLLNIATEIVNPDDYQAVVMFAKAINDGCC